MCIPLIAGQFEKPIPPPLPTKVKEQEKSVDGPTLEAKNPVRKGEAVHYTRVLMDQL